MLKMAISSTFRGLGVKHGLSLWCPEASSVKHELRSLASPLPARSFGKSAFTTSAAFANKNSEFVIVGGGNAAGYAARAFVENGMADGKLCIVSKEKVAPYERPALTKAYLFPLDKKPARLPGFHTCVGSGGERQTPEWYKEKGIEVMYDTTVTGLDVQAQTLTTASGSDINYGSLIIATGCTAARLPDIIGGDLPGVHYIRDITDADSLVSSLVIFPEEHVMARLFTSSLARKYEELYEQNGVKFLRGSSIKGLIAGAHGRVAEVQLDNATTVDADTVIVGIGAKPAINPFEKAGLKTSAGGIQVDSLFQTSVPGVFAIGDVAAFPLKIYNRTTRVEHVDHARKSAQHCVNALLNVHTDPYDYLPYFYSRVFEYEGSSRKVWWQFYGDNVGETVEVGDFNPKYATFWLESGKLKGVFLESGSLEEFAMISKFARKQPHVEKSKLENASSVEDALELVTKSLEIEQ